MRSFPWGPSRSFEKETTPPVSISECLRIYTLDMLNCYQPTITAAGIHSLGSIVEIQAKWCSPEVQAAAAALPRRLT